MKCTSCKPTMMFYQPVFFVITLVDMTAADLESSRFLARKSSEGSDVCFVDVPTEVQWIPSGGSDIRCGLRCVQRSKCEAFNFNSLLGKCDQYETVPSHVSVTPGCKGYIVLDDVATSQNIITTKSALLDSTTIAGMSLPNGVPGQCSFPFTYSGSVYYGCISVTGCLTANRTYQLKCNTTATAVSVVNDSVPIIGQPRVPVQSVFGWIIWMKKVGFSYNWNLPWSSYKNGFGSFNGNNFWLGLETIHQLTSSSNYRLRIEIQDTATLKWYSVEYWSFVVGDETSSQYKLNIDGFSGDTSNALQYIDSVTHATTGYSDGMMFSTNDNDNDNAATVNCASICGGGWWFNGCYWGSVTLSQSYNGWVLPGSTSYFSLQQSRMMFKVQ